MSDAPTPAANECSATNHQPMGQKQALTMSLNAVNIDYEILEGYG